MPKTTCPRCGAEVDAAVALRNPVAPTPKVGDLGVCLRCEGPMEVQADGTLKAIDLHTVADDPFRLLVIAILSIRARKREGWTP
jgi:hypothetical protein